MAAKLTDDERQAIIDLIESGKSARDVARESGRSAQTVSNIARSIGWEFGRKNTAHAREARKAYGAEARAALAARLGEEAERLLDQLHEPYLVFNFGGSDNVYREHLLTEPPIGEKRAIIQAATTAMRTVLDIDRHDNRADSGASAVDDWLRSVIGSATP